MMHAASYGVPGLATGVLSGIVLDRKWLTLVVVCTAIFMLLLDITIVNVALPPISRSLHAGFTDLQWVIDAYALALATCVLNAGSLADLLGRKRVFVAGVVLFTAASALCGAATTPLFLILARAGQGIGGAIMFAVSLALLSQEFQAASAARPSASGARPRARRSR